jgi:hypothetical protein
MKHLVTSGCSFTYDRPTWADHLSASTGMELHNVSMSGAGNHLISTFLIEEVERLLDLGLQERDLCVIVQWSGIFRFDKVVKKKNAWEEGFDWEQRPVHRSQNRKFNTESIPVPPGTDNNWIMCAASRSIGIWPTVYNLMSKEQAFLETLENILRVQWYLKSKNIQYKMFTGWDIFTDGAPKKKSIFCGLDAIVNSGNQFTNDNYENAHHTLLKENCKWFGYLFDLIDWDNFWTHNDKKIKYGGLTQWVKGNLPKSIWFCAPGDQHPSAAAHKQFADRVLAEIIND